MGTLLLACVSGCGQPQQEVDDDSEATVQVAIEPLAGEVGRSAGHPDEHAAAFWSAYGRMYVPAEDQGVGSGVPTASVSPPQRDVPAHLSPPVQRVQPPRSHDAGVEQWRETIARYFPPQEVEKALRVSKCESEWRDIYDDSGQHVGRFQIAWRWHQSRFGHPDELLNPEVNARVAAEIWRDNQGWSPWPYCGRM